MSSIDSSKFDKAKQNNDLDADDLKTQFDNAKTDIESLENTVGNITSDEASQVEQIDSVTITNAQWTHVGNMDQGVATTDAVTFATVDTGQGANELHPMDQGVRTTDAVTFATVDTGNGATEINSAAAKGVTGADNNVVTGTAGANGNLAQWNADGDAVDSGVATSDTLRKPGTSSDPALAFDTWRTPNANRPTLVTVRIRASTDGTTDGSVLINVDESGGTTRDYFYRGAFASANSGSSVDSRQTTTFIVPAGGAYQIENASDPRGVNSIGDNREFTL